MPQFQPVLTFVVLSYSRDCGWPKISIYLLVIPNYWGKQIFTHWRFPKVGQKQNTEGKKERRAKKCFHIKMVTGINLFQMVTCSNGDLFNLK